MPTSLTPVVARTAITKPVGSDVFSLAAITGMNQAIADRAEWAAKGLIVPYRKSLNMGGNDYPNGTSFATIQDIAPIVASFALTVKAGDLVLLFASGSILPTAAGDYRIGFRWYDGTATLSECGFKKGASWASGTNEELLLSLHGADIVSADGSKTYSLQGKVSNVLEIVQGGGDYLELLCVHVKLGAA